MGEGDHSEEDARAAEVAARAAVEAANAAKAAAQEATRALANLQVQAGARLDVMDELAEALTEGRRTMREFIDRIDEMATVEDVRASAAATRAEQAGRRRLTVIRTTAAIVWLIVGVMWGIQEQVEHCSPGSKAFLVTNELTNPRDQLSIDRLQAAARRPAPTWCDATIPTIAHSPGTDWPTAANVGGGLAYAAAAAGTAWLVRRRRWEKDEPPLVPAAVASTP